MKKRLSLAVLGLVLLVILWRRTGVAEIRTALRQMDIGLLWVALALFVPQTLVSAFRWSQLVGLYQPLGLGRAAGLVLAASSLNLVLPSKMGDLVKGAFLDRERAGGDMGTGLALGVVEKALDLGALAAWMLLATALCPPVEPVGWILAAVGAGVILAVALCFSAPAASLLVLLRDSARGGLAGKVLRTLGRAAAMPSLLARHRARFVSVLLLTLLLWFLHLAQFSVIHSAAGGGATEPELWSRVPMAIFVGLLPVTFAGIGTRDAAMLYFLGVSCGEGIALLLGLFATFRYLVVALAGIPCILVLPIDRSLLHRKE